MTKKIDEKNFDEKNLQKNFDKKKFSADMYAKSGIERTEPCTNTKLDIQMHMETDVVTCVDMMLFQLSLIIYKVAPRQHRSLHQKWRTENGWGHGVDIRY